MQVGDGISTRTDRAKIRPQLARPPHQSLDKPHQPPISIVHPQIYINLDNFQKNITKKSSPSISKRKLPIQFLLSRIFGARNTMSIRTNTTQSTAENHLLHPTIRKSIHHAKSHLQHSNRSTKHTESNTGSLHNSVCRCSGGGCSGSGSRS